MRKRKYTCMCDWVTLLYFGKLAEHWKLAIMEKTKIIKKERRREGNRERRKEGGKERKQKKIEGKRESRKKWQKEKRERRERDVFTCVCTSESRAEEDRMP